MRRFFKQFYPSSPDSRGDDKSIEAVGKALSAVQRTNESAQNARRSREPDLQATDPSSQTSQERIHGLVELVSQPSERSDAVDIVALHGLNGHHEKTWIEKKTRTNWLSDSSCLPRDIPNARILSYGYNSTSYFSRGNSDVRDFASALLAALKAKRKSNAEKERPLIFICHSLGGLVFKQLVIRGHEQDSFYGPLLEKIRGVLFLGTPHRGSDLAYWDSIGTRIVRAATLSLTTNTKLSKDLKVDSEMLKRISDSFAYRGAAYKIRSFYETEFMPGLNCCVVDKDSARLGWSNELDIASPSNHSNICKFSSRDDPRYETIVSELLEMIDVAEDDSDLAPLSAREKSCMKHLNSEYPGQLEQVDDAVPQTCEWILSHEKWLQWQSCQHSSLLWITLNAGCGKSVMAKFLVNHFQNGGDANAAQSLAYFFFMEGVARQNNASAAVSALLHQLYCSQKRLLKHAMTKFEGTPSHVFNSFSTLWTVLVSSLGDTGRRDVLWILDALDECETSSLRQFIASIATLLELPITAKLKIILLSRPTNRIQHALGLFAGPDRDPLSPNHSNRFRLVGENECDALNADILHFARWKIDGFASTFPKNVLERLRERLVEGADYTFLWISLVLKMIEDSAIGGMSESDLEKILQTKRINDVYCHLLKEACSANPAKTRRFLAILLAAIRPMTVDEMCAAVEVREDDDTELSEPQVLRKLNGLRQNARHPHEGQSQRTHLQPQAQPLQTLTQQLHRPFDNHIRQLCGHFVRIRRGKIYFVHQTARSFLIKATFRPNQKPGQNRTTEVWKPIRIEDANRTLLRICVAYLRIIGRDTDHKMSQSLDQTQIASYLEMCRSDASKAFFLYAARHWVKHYKPLRKTLKNRYDDLLQPNSNLFRTWIILHKSWMLEQEAMKKEPVAYKVTDVFAHLDPSRSEKHRLDRDFDARFSVLAAWLNEIEDNARQKKVKDDVPENELKDNAPSKELRQRMQTYLLLGQDFDDLVNNPLRLMQYNEMDDMDKLVKEIENTYLKPMRRQIEELDRQREAAFNKDPELEGRLSKQSLSELRSELALDHQGSASEQAKAEIEAGMDLHKVLLHFGLFDPEEAELEEDEFLRDYWQSYIGTDTRRRHQEDKEESYGSDNGDDTSLNDESEDEIPNWVKQYAHAKIKAVARKSLMMRVGTPGVDLPELSSFKERLWEDRSHAAMRMMGNRRGET